MDDPRYKNKNRGYQQLRVWKDAIEFYKLSSGVFGKFPYQLFTGNSFE